MKRDVGAICVRNVVTGYAAESVVDIAKRMRERHVGAVVIVRDDQGTRKPIGIITDRDIVIEAVAPGDVSLDAVVANDLLTRVLVTVEQHDSIDDALAEMRKNGVRRVPVVDSRGGLVGIVAVDDLVELFADRLAELAVLFSREQKIERDTRS